MNFVHREGSRTVIRQIPFLLFVIGGIFSLPMISFSLFHVVRGSDAEGKYFTLFFGLGIFWVVVEFVATRERFTIDQEKKTFTRVVSGLFRTSVQTVNLHQLREVGVEWRVNSRGRRRQHVFLYGPAEPVLVNTPAKVYLDHSKLAKLIAEAAGIPFAGEKTADHFR
jgi:hypothetical protein